MKIETMLKKTVNRHWLVPITFVFGSIIALFFLTLAFAGNGLATTYTLFCIYLFIGTFLIFIEKWAPDERFRLLCIFLIAFFIRYAVAQYLFPYFLEHWTWTFGDSVFYDKIGRMLAYNWPDSPITTAYRYNYIKRVGNLDGYYIYSAIHYLIDGSSQPIATSNAFFSAITSWLLYRTIRRCVPNNVGHRIAFVGSCVYALFPLSIFWSSVHMKEAISMFLVALFLDGFTSFIDKRYCIGSVEMIIAFIVMLHVRNYISVLFFLTFLISLAFLFIDIHRYKQVLIVSIGIIVVSIAIMFFVGAFQKIYLIKLIFQKGIIDMLLEAPSGGGIPQLQHLIYSSPADMMKSMFTMLPLVTLFPLPHFTQDMRIADIYIVSCNVFWLLIFPFALFGGWEACRHGTVVKVCPIAIFTVMLVSTLALILSTSARQVTSLYPLYCFFAAFGISQWRRAMPFVLLIYLVTIVITAMREGVSIFFIAPIIGICAAVLLFYVFFTLPKPQKRRLGDES